MWLKKQKLRQACWDFFVCFIVLSILKEKKIQPRKQAYVCQANTLTVHYQNASNS